MLKELFERKTVSQVLKDREILAPELYDYANEERKNSYLSHLIRNLGNKSLKIKRNYDIIPRGRKPLRDLKKGEVIKLKRYSSIDDALEDNATPKKLFIDSLNKIEYLRSGFIGYEWQGISKSSSQYKIVPFSELFQGELIFMNENDEEPIIIKSYSDFKDVIKRGGLSMVDVPSVSKKEVKNYRIKFSHIPFKLKKNKSFNPIWFDLISDHSSCAEQNYYTLHYGREYFGSYRKGDEKVFDAHEIASYWGIMKFFKYYNEKLNVSDNPFFFLSKESFNLINVMRNQIVKEYESGGKIKLRILNDKEISRLFSMQLAKERELLEIRKSSYIGNKIFDKYFNPKNLDFAKY
jgi:hypothetical protein